MTVNAADTTDSSSSVKVTPATGTQASDYDKFELTVCPGDTTTGCPVFDCLPGSLEACTVPLPSAGAQYSVTAVGVQGTKQSLASQPATFFARYP